jgi:drug/metabolite transporter (DMT)-like permease
MILVAALVHAWWNALVKGEGDRATLLKMMSLTQLACSVCLIPFVAFPARESWPYLCVSAVLGTVCMLFLNWAYRVGDLSHVYPFARGTAPLIVAIISVACLGEQIGHLGEIAVVLIASGIASLALTRGAAGLREPRPVILSLIAGAFVAAYTITDALGARSAGSPHSYYAWNILVYAILATGSFHLLYRGVTLGRTLRNGHFWRDELCLFLGRHLGIYPGSGGHGLGTSGDQYRIRRNNRGSFPTRAVEPDAVGLDTDNPGWDDFAQAQSLADQSSRKE